MSMYDDFYNHRSKREKKRGFSFLSSLFSAMIGGLIVILILPTLINMGLIDIQIEGNAVNTSGSIDYLPTVNQQQVSLVVDSNIVQAVEKVKPAVVGVINIQEQSNIFSRQTQAVDAGEGSGFVIDIKEGKAYIVTNYHVIENAKSIEVALASGERVSAELLGSDQLTDLAVVAIDQKYVDVSAVLGDSTVLRIGEPAIAIGNPLGTKFSQTVTVGVISSNNRTIPVDLDGNLQTDWETDVIQTDAAINPGNSGGPLVNVEGYVIGINSAKISESGVEGLGFAIPISDAKPIIDELIKFGKIKRAYMGITPYDLNTVTEQEKQTTLKLPSDVSKGIVLYDVSVPGPAAAAGLQKLDVIVELDGQALNNSSDLRKYLYSKKKVGDKMTVTYYREGKLQSTELTLESIPDIN